MRVLLGFVLGVFLGLAATAAEAGERVALVLSAQSYQFLRPLDNPEMMRKPLAIRSVSSASTFRRTDRSLKNCGKCADDFQKMRNARGRAL